MVVQWADNDYGPGWAGAASLLFDDMAWFMLDGAAPPDLGCRGCGQVGATSTLEMAWGTSSTNCARCSLDRCGDFQVPREKLRRRWYLRATVGPRARLLLSLEVSLLLTGTFLDAQLLGIRVDLVLYLAPEVSAGAPSPRRPQQSLRRSIVLSLSRIATPTARSYQELSLRVE